MHKEYSYNKLRVKRWKKLINVLFVLNTVYLRLNVIILIAKNVKQILFKIILILINVVEEKILK